MDYGWWLVAAVGWLGVSVLIVGCHIAAAVREQAKAARATTGVLLEAIRQLKEIDWGQWEREQRRRASDNLD